MARAAIQNKLKRQPSGMPDSWKRGKTNDNNLSKAQSIRREDDVGEDDDEAMEITQEEKSSGENLPTSSLEEDVGEVLESTPNLSTGSTNILQDDSQVGENADNEVNPQVPESTPKNKEIDSGEVSEVSEVSNGATTRSHRNTRSASDIGGVPLVGKQRDSNTEVSSDDEGNYYIDYSYSYYSFNII